MIKYINEIDLYHYWAITLASNTGDYFDIFSRQINKKYPEHYKKCLLKAINRSRDIMGNVIRTSIGEKQCVLTIYCIESDFTNKKIITKKLKEGVNRIVNKQPLSVPVIFSLESLNINLIDSISTLNDVWGINKKKCYIIK